MADFYDDMRAMASSLLASTSEGGLGQGLIQLVRTNKSPVDPSRPWVIPEETTTEETLKGVVKGVNKELVGTEVGGTILLMSDRVVTCSVPDMQYTAGDVLRIDGVPVHILSVEKVPAAGTTVAVKFTVRG